ncbi:aspartate aminotransferase family protein [Rhodococcus sp. NPDC057297]|uniref:aspartate aminotransferase family protein n=1 Tax=Rhodococcus sp. NPDC057297 TaxID=3346090 RepID=UPI00363BD855
MPHPIYIEHGTGAHFTDIDGNTFLDCNAGWNAAFLGRAHPAITSAVHDAMTTLGAPGGSMHPSPKRDEFARLLCARVPGAEKMVFAPSGSEANTYALRLARSYTGKQTVIRMAGGYHGQHDALLGEQSSKTGTAPAAQNNIVTVPFNDLTAARAALEAHHDTVAALIVEPMMTIPGAIHQRGHYLKDLRTLTTEFDVLLILDEVITGCRFAQGGASEYYGFDPADLVVMGKMLGGGLPTAAVVGRGAILEQPISASNTHAQNPVTLAAAVAALELSTADEYRRVASMGERLRSGLRACTESLPIPVQITGDGPCAGIHFTSDDVHDYASADAANDDLWRLMCVGITNRGLGLTSRTFGPTIAWTDTDVDHALDVFSSTIVDISHAASATEVSTR